MTHKIPNRDTEDEILKALRPFDDHETGGSTIGFKEFFKIMTHKIQNRDTADEIHLGCRASSARGT